MTQVSPEIAWLESLAGQFPQVLVKQTSQVVTSQQILLNDGNVKHCEVKKKILRDPVKEAWQ